MRVYALVVGVLLGLSGCASVRQGDAGQEGAQKTFMPKPGVAGIYIYRNDGIGGFTKMDVAVDGRNIGQIANKTYLYAEVTPGPHVVTGKSGETSIGGVEINAVPAKLYYVKQASNEGWFSVGSSLRAVDAIEAQRELKQSSLAAGPPESASAP